MSIFDVISLFGGLAFFLYGMSLMGSGLKKMAGGRMASILEKLSSSPLKGLLLGTLVTAMIQSSSATTVMVVGFVNSGIMELRQAISVIIGANIGTTITGWILTLSEINGESILMSLLKPTSFSPILALIGTILVCFIKDEKKNSTGTVVLGFAILMYGMSAMSSAASPLKDSPAFINALTAFSEYPVLGLITGAALTALIQSSSASIGILQALSATGGITYAIAIPTILGMNIGACVPVLLSSIGANKNGKRTAFVYLYFNIIISVLFCVPFYILQSIFDFAVVGSTANAVGIAIFNTGYKIVFAIFIVPLSHILEKLVMVTFPDKAENNEKPEVVSELLDERFLRSPGVALVQAKNVVQQMAQLDLFSINSAISLLDEYDEESAQSIMLNEEITDEYEDKLGTYLIRISASSLNDSESRDVSKLLHVIGDLERISDHAVNIVEVAKEISEKEIEFSHGAQKELDALNSAIEEIIRNAINSLQRDDSALASTIEPLEDVIDEICKTMKNNHITRLREGDCTIETGFIFDDIITNCERIADHCSNIAVCVIRMKEDAGDFHEYLKNIKEEDSGEYHEMFGEYSDKYLTRLA